MAVQALVALGGVAALSWEVIWQLQASLALGVSALATAIIVSTTMAGMTLGALATGSWLRTRRIDNPLRLYGLLELGIGSAGLLLLTGFEWIESLDARVYAAAPRLALPFAALAMATLIGPPTFAMGASIPVFARVSQHYGVPLSHLYGINTLGAAAGALLIAFLLIRTFGVATTTALVAGVNLLVCLGATLVGSRHAPPDLAAPLDPQGALSSRISLPVASALAFTTGFATFGLEIAWFRALRAAFQAVTESFAIMLVAVLIPLGVGAALCPACDDAMWVPAACSSSPP